MFLTKKHWLFFHVKKYKGVKMMCRIIKDFEISLIEDSKSAKTIESYVGDIKVFKELL